MNGRRTELVTASAEALWRFLMVSEVLARQAAGEKRANVVAALADREHRHLDGRGSRRRSRATLYRYLADFERDGIAGLEPAGRSQCRFRTVLPADLVAFVTEEKRRDPQASVPDVIQRARELGVVGPCARIDRTTVWRLCRRLGLPVRRRKKARDRDSRRFEFPHRMDMVLCDGKHFRAGPGRAKRVALFFIDDRTRMGLHVVVGTSESKELFLRGLYELLRRHGRFSMLYADHGPGFIAGDTIDVVRKLGALLVHGEVAYPEGHGKVERFNQTALHKLLRHLPGRPDVNPDCSALELRLGHFVREVYNQTPHESLGKQTPSERYHSDDRPLRFHDDDRQLRRCFVVQVERRVSNDHVVSLDGVKYEVPRGHAGERVCLHRRLLDGTVAILHDGRLVDIQPVDLAANARSHRGQAGDNNNEPGEPLTMGAADHAFLRAMGPVVGPDGGFTDHGDS